MRKTTCLMAAVLCLAGALPAQAATKVSGTIKSYECGDNCYLTITTAKGKELTGLCAAKACRPWNEAAEMPAGMIGRKVIIGVGKGTQYDGAGNAMGEFPSFDTITFKP